MYAIHEGKPTSDFWQFKQYWDPVNQQAKLIQFGHGGMIGDGFVRPNLTGQMETIQTFSSPKRNAYQERHLSYMTEAGQITTSYNLDASGDWQQQRSYLWIKEPQNKDE